MHRCLSPQHFHISSASNNQDIVSHSLESNLGIQIPKKPVTSLVISISPFPSTRPPSTSAPNLDDGSQQAPAHCGSAGLPLDTRVVIVPITVLPAACGSLGARLGPLALTVLRPGSLSFVYWASPSAIFALLSGIHTAVWCSIAVCTHYTVSCRMRYLG